MVTIRPSSAANLHKRACTRGRRCCHAQVRMGSLSHARGRRGGRVRATYSCSLGTSSTSANGSLTNTTSRTSEKKTQSYLESSDKHDDGRTSGGSEEVDGAWASQAHGGAIGDDEGAEACNQYPPLLRAQGRKVAAEVTPPVLGRCLGLGPCIVRHRAHLHSCHSVFFEQRSHHPCYLDVGRDHRCRTVN